MDEMKKMQDPMTAKAWYAGSDYFRQAYLNPPPPVILNVTHFKVPIEFKLNQLPTEEALEDCFRFFNWVDRDFEALDEVNKFARDTDTHASMSVGDIVELRGEYYLCMPVGWGRLTKGKEGTLTTLMVSHDSAI